MPSNTVLLPREPLTRLLGREADVARVNAALESGCRLVTLLGPPGIGKTRVATYVASRWAERTGDRVRVCDLANVGSADEALTVLATAGGVPLDISPPPMHLVLRVPPVPKPIFVLDGAENAGLGASVAWLLAEHPSLVLLVTSTSRLQVAGERVIELDPIDENDAVDLFEERAAAHSRGFSVSVGNRPVVLEIVRELECIPLAVEVAAAQTVILGVHDLLTRLRARGPTDSSSQSSLGTAFRTAWDSLSEPERRSLAQAAVFEAGFDLCMAEAVIEVPSGTSVADQLVQLRDRSLLRNLRLNRGEHRFALYRSIRDAVREWSLGQTLEADAWKRKDRYLVGRVCALDHAGRESRLRELDDLCPDLRRLVAETSTVTDCSSLADRLAVGAALGDLACVQGPPREALATLDRLLAEQTGENGGVARARFTRARLKHLEGDLQEAWEELGRAEAAGASVEPSLLCDVSLLRADIARIRGEFDLAREHADRAAERAAVSADLAAASRVHSSLANLQLAAGALDEAAEAFEHSIHARRAVLDHFGEAADLSNLAVLEHLRGDHQAATRRSEAALKIHRMLGNDRFVGIALCDLARIAFEDGAITMALTRLDEAIPLLDAVGDLGQFSIAVALRGACAAHRGRLTVARDDADIARNSVATFGTGSSLATVELYALHRLLAEALWCLAGARESDAAALIDRVEQTLERHVATSPASDDVRLAARVLKGGLDRGRKAAQTVLVGADGGFIRSPERGRIELGSRPSLKRLVSALVAGHWEGRGCACSTEDLVLAAWGEERMTARSAKNRLQVALSQLRKDGLKEVLCRSGDGYRLKGEILIVPTESSDPSV